jgi:hypothetical protein
MLSAVVFVQVSHKVTAPDNPALEYYKRVYQEHPGFAMPEHYMEVPTWIPVVSGKLPGYTKALHVMTDLLKTAYTLMQYRHESTVFMASVMDVNAEVIRKLVHLSADKKWVLSGYVDPAMFKQYKNVTWVNSVAELGEVFDYFKPLGKPDYSLFKGEMTVPRITLSEGCLYDCSFCTISREVVERSGDDILGQVNALRDLWFDLVYVDDKTFGQANNWQYLKMLGPHIKSYNPYFRGFVVQTTVPMALKHAEEWADQYHVRYIEVGVEHVDAEYLHRMKKPYNVNQLAALMHHLEDVNVGFIPNIMFALPSAEYTPTLTWLKRWRHLISFINPFILCQYGQSKGALVTDAAGCHDQDENSLVKSWLNPAQQAYAQEVWDEALAITGG